jgi:hypothetical protein
MDDWDVEELDDASTWFFGSCHRKRIARWPAGAPVKGRRMWRPTTRAGSGPAHGQGNIPLQTA